MYRLQVFAIALAALSLAGVGAVSAYDAHHHTHGTSADYDWRPRGIVLWSLGRSGTSAFWETMHTWCMDSGLKINTICHMKEGFRTEPVSVSRLER